MCMENKITIKSIRSVIFLLCKTHGVEFKSGITLLNFGWGLYPDLDDGWYETIINGIFNWPKNWPSSSLVKEYV